MFEVTRKNGRLLISAKHGYPFEISFERIAGQTLERGLRPDKAGRPVHLWVNRAERSKDHLSKTKGEKLAHSIFLKVQQISRVAGEILVASITAEGNRYVFARHLTDKICRQPGRIGKRLVVMPR